MNTKREPLFNVPGAVLAVLLLLLGVHLLRVALAPNVDATLVQHLAFVPLRLTALFEPAGVSSRVAAWAAGTGDDPQRGELASFFLSAPIWVGVTTLLTYALLHGGWAHVGLNGIWLLAFGTPVARRFGSGRFVAFLAVTAVAGALTHWLLFPFGAEPLVGASAAVSGCMGAALRFAFRPHDAETSDREPLSRTLRDRRVLSFLVAWFLSNALFGIGSMSFGLSDQPVAWQAHIGGFLAGLLFFPVFDRRAAASPEPQPPLAP
jgi:membrane associated rhomboid family serine protease